MHIFNGEALFNEKKSWYCTLLGFYMLIFQTYFSFKNFMLCLKK